MSNSIPSRQNEFVHLVRASREIYSRVKLIGSLQLFLSLLLALGGPITVAVVAHFNINAAPTAKAWIGLLAIATIVVEVVFLEPLVKNWQETGARIQEQFDTRVYELRWNEVKAGERVDAGIIGSLIRTHKKRYPDDSKFLNWYPIDAGDVPISYARFICQASSMRWDSSLRRMFCLFYTIVIVLLLLGSLCYSTAANYDMQAVILAVFMPLMPAIRQVWRSYKQQAEAAADMERATGHLNKVWKSLLDGSLSDSDAEYEARMLQDELFGRRRRAPPIPEQLYQFTRDDHEERMKQSAKEKVEEVRLQLSKRADVNIEAT